MMTKIQRIGMFLMASSLVSGSAFAAPAYDAIIRGGTIMDGSGLPGFKGDVALDDGHVVAVGNLGNAEAERVIDATGLVVAPGFINIHSHSAPEAVPSAVNTLLQGVTTEITNADGHGSTDITRQLQTFSANGMAENIGLYIGFNAAWIEVVGMDDRRATADEIGRMQTIIDSNLARGAWGVAAGLDYKPGFYATTDEVVKVVSVARPWRTNFPNHDRLREEQNYSSYKAMEETIVIGERAGLVPVITHMKSQGHEQGNAPAVIKMMRDATARGTYVAADVYPYLAGHTGLHSLLVPGWAQDGGRPAMLERFKDPALRAKIVTEIERAMQQRLGNVDGKAVFVLPIRRQLDDVMAEEGVGAGEAVIRLLEQDEYQMIATFGSEEDLKAFLTYPDTAMACDCGARPEGEKAHPRNYGSFPRVLGHYVRDGKLMGWEEAIRKMTALPATIIGMTDRGYLAPGMTADIAVFDPKTITDKATYEDPILYAEGVRYVFVNGRLAVAEGKATGAKGGAPILRSAHMPSRKMTPASKERAVSAEASSADLQVKLEARQAGGQRVSGGQIRIVEKASGTVWTSRELGVLQTAPGWASLTAMVEDGKGNSRPVTVTVDHAGAGDAKPAVIVDSAGAGSKSAVPVRTPTIR
ncbi:N-acyl-D-amino-acid deacylase family protein [Sphingosinicella rhizophila]|uniref:Amidohydrolase family protein n=1 Tax=Sphingosinicella rhizophila TaxID=3050082 RepID=A0ABU3QCH0_9SPHN|nr:amidohydrolase family protein [Sphingosinicella sp. GR2756]MDT9600673.1 amidohydrolase family protein [Sphingosinicella sp. GR2756]